VKQKLLPNLDRDHETLFIRLGAPPSNLFSWYFIINVEAYPGIFSWSRSSRQHTFGDTDNHVVIMICCAENIEASPFPTICSSVDNWI